jgi:uncharacterized repeat protein (TIGR01451 family)
LPSGQQTTIDLFITNVQDLLGWATSINYDPALVNITAINVKMFQAADGRSFIVNASDPTPDSDGSFYASAIDLAAPPYQDSGSGVLARITITALAPGIASLTIANPSLTDVNGNFIGDTNGDSFFDGSVFHAQIYVDLPCPTDLAIDKDDDPDPVAAGHDLSYLLTVANQGPSPATNVVVTDNLPAGVAFGSATPSQGSCSQLAGVVTCNLGSIAAGASATISIAVTVDLSTLGDITNVATVASDAPELDPADNSSSEATSVLAPMPSTLGIDADPWEYPANTATSLGSRHPCVMLSSGQQADIDLFVTNVQDLLGWATSIDYDPALISIDSINVKMFQAADGRSRIVNLSDPTPESDGSFYASAIDLAAPPYQDSGSGVLARITITALAPGVASLVIANPSLTDVNGNYIGDFNGDSFFDGSVFNAQIAIDQLCPGLPATTVGVDADPSQSPANTATSLGSREACFSIPSGQQTDVDLFVTDVQELLGWAAYISYNPALLNITAINVRMFQAADGKSFVVNVSDPTPDSDGSFYASAIDLAAPPYQDSGSGVLARITIAALAPGTSPLTISLPYLTDVDGNPIGDISADGYFDGPAFDAKISIDSPCSGDPDPTPTPTETPTPTPTETPTPTPTETPTPTPTETPTPPADADADTVPDPIDNCPLVFNPDQQDVDGDGLGDVCDPDTQASSAVSDPVTGAVSVSNPQSTISFVGTTATLGSTVTIVEDTTAVGTIESTVQGIWVVGSRFDLVSPSLITGTVTNVIDFAPPGITQTELDSLAITKQMPSGPTVIPHTVVSTVTDAGLIVQATIQYQLVDDALMTALAPLDSDDDGVFDQFDLNGDGDFRDVEERDNCPLVPNADQTDTDGDGAGDACDPDRDGDGYSNAYELRAGSDPANPNSTPEVCDGADNDADTQVDEGFPDSDGDGTKDCLEANVDTDGDTLPNSIDPDDDNDGFSDAVENYIGTDSLASCPRSPSHDAWPLDINIDTHANTLDVLLFKPVIQSQMGDLNYDKRFDLDANGKVSILDVLLFKPFLLSQCS